MTKTGYYLRPYLNGILSDLSPDSYRDYEMWRRLRNR